MTEEQAALPPEIKRELTRATKLRAQAKALEIEAKEMTSQAKDILLPLMAAHDISLYEVEGVGTVRKKTNSGSTINKDLLIEALLLSGLDSKKVNGIIEKATKRWSTEYVDFNFPKKVK